MEDKWLEDLKELKCLSERDLKLLCEKAKEIFIEEQLNQKNPLKTTLIKNKKK